MKTVTARAGRQANELRPWSFELDFAPHAEGSILISSNQHMGRTAPVFYPVHIVFAYADQIVGDIDEAFAAMKKKYGTNLPSMMNLNTGPSRTADIEKTLVVGVHGPAEVFCFFVNADSGAFYKK